MSYQSRANSDGPRDVIHPKAQEWMNRKRGKYGWVSWLGLVALAPLLVMAPASIGFYVLMVVALALLLIGTRLERREEGGNSDPKAKTEYRV